MKLAKARDVLIIIAILLSGVYFAGKMYAVEKCQLERKYIFTTGIKKMPPIFKHAVIDNMKGCKVI